MSPALFLTRPKKSSNSKMFSKREIEIRQFQSILVGCVCMLLMNFAMVEIGKLYSATCIIHTFGFTTIRLSYMHWIRKHSILNSVL